MFRVARPWERIYHMRLGRFIGLKGPGLVFPVIPVIDQVERMSLREFVVDVEPQTTITKDNAPVSVDMLIFMRVVDPETTVTKAENFRALSRGIAITTLRAVIGDIPLDDVLSKREQINQVMQARLDEVTDRWGVKVNAVEIREILPPRDIQEAMSRQMSAERTRRAVVTEAEGSRQAAITIAEGNKQAAILNAEGNRQAAILNAEGTRQAAILNAEGFSIGLQRIFETARGVDNKTMTLQYLDMLKDIGASPSTKWIVPLDLVSMAGSLTGTLAGGLAGGASQGNSPPSGET
ncbi:MAG: SPFH domain-containing protein [Dehalococcoidia bacterium]